MTDITEAPHLRAEMDLTVSLVRESFDAAFRVSGGFRLFRSPLICSKRLRKTEVNRIIQNDLNGKLSWL